MRLLPIKRHLGPRRSGSAQRLRVGKGGRGPNLTISFSGKIAKKVVAIFARRTQETFPGMVEGLSAISVVQNPCRLVGCAASQEWSMVRCDGKASVPALRRRIAPKSQINLSNV